MKFFYLNRNIKYKNKIFEMEIKFSKVKVFDYDESELSKYKLRKYEYVYIIITTSTTDLKRIKCIQKNIERINIKSKIPLVIIIERIKGYESYIDKLLNEYSRDMIYVIPYDEPLNSMERGSGKTRTAAIYYVSNYLYNYMNKDTIVIIGDDRRLIRPIQPRNKRRETENIRDTLKAFNKLDGIHPKFKSMTENYIKINEIVCPSPEQTSHLYKDRKTCITLAQQIYIGRLQTWKNIQDRGFNRFWAPIFQDYPFIHTLSQNGFKIKTSKICLRGRYTTCKSIARVPNRKYSKSSEEEIRKMTKIVNLRYDENGKLGFDIGKEFKRMEDGFDSQITVFDRIGCMPPKPFNSNRKRKYSQNTSKNKKSKR